ncbi:MAG: SH3 domain-containing C40 family peptidase [Gemmatimonadota bacterium]
MSEVDTLVAEVGGEYAPDPRTSIFEISVEGEALVGQTTQPDGVEALVGLLAERGVAVRDEVVRLPDPLLREGRCALVASAYAPMHARPSVRGVQVSQYVLGVRLDVLTMRDGWLRVRGEEGYIGWVHPGYLEVGEEEWAREWETGSAGEPLVSLGADLHDEAGRTIARLPWGARVIRDQPRSVLLPDGRRGVLGGGELIPLARRADRFPARGDSVVRSAREWLGVPYLWGGSTRAGVDCSGFVQSVMWMHGIALPRDADMQALVGESLDTEPAGHRAGDLVFFHHGGERIEHVAMSMGGGALIHCAIANGEVATNDLDGAGRLDRDLRGRLVSARRVLPD